MTYGRAIAGSIFLISILLGGEEVRADNPLGFYAGGGIGQSRVEASVPLAPVFRENHSAFKVLAGIRPISMIGAEVAYIDFGHPGRQTGFLASDVKMKGESAFGVLYLLVPTVDVFLKAGSARLDTTASTGIVCAFGQPCPLVLSPAPAKGTNVGFAAGVGAQNQSR